jgi:hypothetical protein
MRGGYGGCWRGFQQRAGYRGPPGLRGRPAGFHGGADAAGAGGPIGGGRFALRGFQLGGARGRGQIGGELAEIARGELIGEADRGHCAIA